MHLEIYIYIPDLEIYIYIYKYWDIHIYIYIYRPIFFDAGGFLAIMTTPHLRKVHPMKEISVVIG